MKIPVIGINVQKIFCTLGVLAVALSSPARAQDAGNGRVIFPDIRRLELEGARSLAMKRSAQIRLQQAKLSQREAEQREVNRRVKLNAAGGFDPISREVRYYLNLDLERLLKLNKGERDAARQAVEQERINQETANAEALQRVTQAWFALRTAEANVRSAAKVREMAQASFIAADARFRAGAGELSAVLAAMRAQNESAAGYETARQNVAVACLALAQACGYATAEEMEAAL